jgi:hypothetical protein
MGVPHPFQSKLSLEPISEILANTLGKQETCVNQQISFF